MEINVSWFYPLVPAYCLPSIVCIRVRHSSTTMKKISTKTCSSRAFPWACLQRPSISPCLSRACLREPCSFSTSRIWLISSQCSKAWEQRPVCCIQMFTTASSNSSGCHSNIWKQSFNNTERWETNRRWGCSWHYHCCFCCAFSYGNLLCKSHSPSQHESSQ